MRDSFGIFSVLYPLISLGPVWWDSVGISKINPVRFSCGGLLAGFCPCQHETEETVLVVLTKLKVWFRPNKTIRMKSELLQKFEDEKFRLNRSNQRCR